MKPAIFALALVAVAGTALASGVAFHVPSAEDKTVTVQGVEAAAGPPEYVLGLHTVSQREVTPDGPTVRVHLQFQTGEHWYHNQTITGHRGSSYLVAPADLPYGVEFPDETAYVRITSPALESDSPAEAAERLAQAVGVPAASASAWTKGGSAGDARIYSGITTTEPGFYLDCGACEVWTRTGTDASASMNTARALVADGRVVLFEATRWVDLDATPVLEPDAVEAQVVQEMQERGFGERALEAKGLALEGDRLLYKLVPATAGTNLTEVHADALTGDFVRVIGLPSGVVDPTANGGKGSLSESNENPTPGVGAAFLVAAVAVLALLAPRRR